MGVLQVVRTHGGGGMGGTSFHDETTDVSS